MLISNRLNSMALESDLTIKRVYDNYKLRDFRYADPSSINLNPRREISFDRLDSVVARLQEITDEIILKQIKGPVDPRDVEDFVINGSVGSESGPASLNLKGDLIPFKKQAMLAQTGGIGNALLFPVISPNPDDKLGLEQLLETIIGTFPVEELLDQFDGPPQLDCELILKRFETKNDQWESDDDDDDDKKDSNNSNSGSNADGSGSAGDDSGSGSDDGSSDDSGNADDGTGANDGGGDSDKFKKCAEIELTWLRIILVIVKILRMLRMIVDLVLSIIIPILEILRLAVGAWINPPNIPSIVQVIMKMVTAIIIMIIGLIIQLIWNLLNLDCIADQTQSIINQIRQALQAFSSIMSSFNPNAVNMLSNKIDRDVINPINDIIGQAQDNVKAWAGIKEDMKKQWDTLTSRDFWDDIQSDMVKEIKTGVLNNPNVQEVVGLKNQIQRLLNADLKNALDSMNEAAEGGKAAMQIVRGTGLQMMAHPTIVLGTVSERVPPPQPGEDPMELARRTAERMEAQRRIAEENAKKGKQ